MLGTLSGLYTLFNLKEWVKQTVQDDKASK